MLPLVLLAAAIGTAIALASSKKTPPPAPAHPALPPAAPPPPQPAAIPSLDATIPADVKDAVLKAVTTETDPKKLLAYAQSLMPDLPLAARSLTDAAKKYLPPAPASLPALPPQPMLSGYNMYGMPVIGVDPNDTHIMPGTVLKKGEFRMTKNGRGKLIMQTDGNLVLYDVHGNKPLWDSKTNGKPVAYAIMQTDGNFVLYDNKKHPFWATGTDKHPGAYLVLQNDGNLVVYQGQKALWHSNSYGFSKHESHGILDAIPDFMNPVKIAEAAYKGVKSGVESVADVVTSVADRMKKIPGLAQVEGLVETAGGAFVAPFAAATAIANGERIDKALGGMVKQWGNSAEVLSTVASVIPGVGTGIAAAIGAASALAQGQNITDALIAGVKSGIPGGPLVQEAFDVATKTVTRAVQGERIDQALLDAARTKIPGGKAGQAAFDMGIALASGKKIQDVGMAGVKDILPDSPAAHQAFDTTQKIISSGAPKAIAALVTKTGHAPASTLPKPPLPPHPNFAHLVQKLPPTPKPVLARLKRQIDANAGAHAMRKTIAFAQNGNLEAKEQLIKMGTTIARKRWTDHYVKGAPAPATA